MDVLIGFSCFICGFLMMFAIHRVIFDYYAGKSEAVIKELKRQMHTYAEPDDVADLKFNE